MIYPIPPGTRDVLPDEMRELRRLHMALVDVFERYGYGEVRTPTIEYEEVLSRGDGRGVESAYRLFDERGELLALRSDMTIPIARLVASRFAEADQPIRLCYIANAYRAVRPESGRLREFGQAGVELIGGSPTDGTAEVIEVLESALDAAGLTRAVIGLGDADLHSQMMREFGVSEAVSNVAQQMLERHDLVGLDDELSQADDVSAEQRRAVVEIAQLRGGREVLDRARSIGGPAVEGAISRIEQTFEALERRNAAERVQIDLGLLRDLGYYSGAIVEVYDPALGHIIGGGGRYDGLMARFGMESPAAGFTLYLESLHTAQAGEELAREQSSDGDDDADADSNPESPGSRA